MFSISEAAWTGYYHLHSCNSSIDCRDLSKADGQPLELEDIEKDLPQYALRMLRESKWTFITWEAVCARPHMRLHRRFDHLIKVPWAESGHMRVWPA
ncbi:hypothetical protein QJS04_geneDACA022899 [Acorus gramineus]|uniref:Uncharacterized protein n=1 Tax=Acorus gramineus TaxID=55184 RepID=A0AAV9AIB4_ACOGR|nr:hypothetical protein QJS04_geneDACA022899 [Acorus gramineus]